MKWLRRFWAWLPIAAGAIGALLLYLLGSTGGKRREMVRTLKRKIDALGRQEHDQEAVVDEAEKARQAIEADNAERARARAEAREEFTNDTKADPSAGGSARRLRDLLRRRNRT